MMKYFFTFLLAFQIISNVEAKPNPGKPEDISKIIPDDLGEKPFENVLNNNLPGIDNDGDGFCEADSCLGSDIQPGDCDDEDADVSPKALEECGDEVDNDCDGVTDDFEIDDEGDTVYCKEQSCTDGKSDDVDSLVDCYDSDCDADPSCANFDEDPLPLADLLSGGAGCSLRLSSRE